MAPAVSSTANSPAQDRAVISAQLARDATIEINVHDVVHLEESRRLLPAGKAVYVSHLPKQQWRETETACRAVRDAGFRPVPHVPVRLLSDAAAVDGVLGGFVDAAQVDEVLLISGDRLSPTAASYWMTPKALEFRVRHGIAANQEISRQLHF